MSTSGISFSGVGSGLPVSDWIEAMVKVERQPVDALYTKKDTYNTSLTAISSLQSQFSSLRTSVQKLTDGNIASVFDLFKAKTATSSDSSIATVTATNSASPQKISLEVQSLATATKAKTLTNFGNYIDGSETFTELSNGVGEAGTISLYANGIKNEITIEDTDTLNDIADKINQSFSVGGVSNLVASVSDNKFNITYNNNEYSDVAFGSSADTSNFFNVMKLSTSQFVDNGDGTTTAVSNSNISKIKLSGTLVSNTANLNVSEAITAGTFKIGNAEFTIDANTTVNSIMSKINNDEDSGVTASFDPTTNKLVLTSKDPGKTYISMESGTSNFLEQAGLIDGSGNTLQSQTLGQNAKVFINNKSTDVPAPTPLEVNSNTITSDISGIVGVTINLKALSSSDTPLGTPIDISINQDTDSIYNALNDFVTKFNSAISAVDTNTALDGDLHGEYSLTTIRNSLRMLVSNQVSGLSTYDSLGIIGISSGSAGKSVNDTSVNISINKDKFIEALQDNPDEVRKLMIGDGTDGVTGILQQMEDRLDALLDPVDGYFSTRKDSINTSITDVDKSIQKGEDRLVQYKTLITQQFSQMDQYISQLQQQSTAISGLS